MKHKHYDLIVAWANGAKIQYLSYNLECAELKRLGLGKNCETRVWLDCVNAPNWYTDFEYRIKPETNERIIDVLKANIEQQAKEIDELRKELALQRLSDIGQAIERELSDEQMLEVYKKVFNKQNEFKENLKRRSYFDFARAILKKASEK